MSLRTDLNTEELFICSERAVIKMKLALLCIGLLHHVSSHSLTTLDDLEMADDTVSVGSYIREVRAAAPEDHQNYNSEESEGEIGYSRKKEGGGKKGYQRFDTYQKKSGDNYALAKEDSYGYDDEGQDGAYSHRQEKKAKAKEERNPEPEDEERITHQNERLEKLKDTDTTDFTKHRHYEELKEGASDGNGGVEAHGHDHRDYILPEKYTWGKDDEYKF